MDTPDDPNAEIETQTLSDGSVAYNVLYLLSQEGHEHPGPVRFACLDREHAQVLCAALDRVAWTEDVS